MTTPFIVLDTNIALDLFVFHDKSTIFLKTLLENKTLKAITRDACYEEYVRVLHYPTLKLNEDRILESQKEFNQFVCRPDFPFQDYKVLPKCKDEDDQKFLELALDANALALITKDKALLKLATKTKHLFRITKLNDFVIYSLLNNSSQNK